MPTPTPEEERVMAMLKERTDAAGSIRAYAAAHGLCHTYVSDVLKGAKSPGPSVLLALRLTKIVSYVELDAADLGGRS
jgi:hypothetical protein